MPVGAACPDVLYRPAPATSNTNLSAPAPQAPYPVTLDIFNGENPNGQWKLYVVDSRDGSTGEVKRGWTLTLTTGDVDATIPGTGTSGLANPFPATVDVADQPGVITDLDVQLNGVWHERPDDLDLLLVGPKGQSVVLASDACGTAPVVGANWRWNDEALGPMPDGDDRPLCGSGQYQPVDHDPGDAPPDPAPAPPFGDRLSAFDLTDPNGQWKLFVLDDESGKTGFLTNRFDLEMTTREKATVAFSESAVRLGEGGRRDLTLRRSASSDLLAGEVKVSTAPGSAGSPGDFTPVSTTVKFAAGEREKRVSIDARADGVREADEAYTVAIGSPTGDAQVGSPSRVGVTIPGSGPGAGSAGPAPRCAGKRATIVGTPRRNRLRGTRRSDVIVGLGGNDVIRGGGGNDTICAGSGKDRVRAAAATTASPVRPGTTAWPETRAATASAVAAGAIAASAAPAATAPAANASEASDRPHNPERNRQMSATVEMDQLKAAHRATWDSGNYASVAQTQVLEVGETTAAAAGVQPGRRCSTWPPARATRRSPPPRPGARVTGLDLAPTLLEVARRRADAAGVEIEWVEGDAEALPYDDESFDTVLSAIGVQFAPRHELAAPELARVVRPGGTIVLANWTPRGFIGQFFKTISPRLPKPPEGASPPPLWGDEEHLRGLFADTGVELEVEHHSVVFEHDSPTSFVDYMADDYGPLLKARERLEPEGTWEELRSDLIALCERSNVAADSFLAPSEYLLVRGRKEG